MLGENKCDGCDKVLTYEVEDGKTYSRVIGVEYMGGYDGVSEWMCPDCGRREGRWIKKVLSKGETEPPFGEY